MKRIAIGLVLLAALAVSARAADQEDDSNNLLLQQWKTRQKENADVEKQYKRTLQQTDVKAAPAGNDPWATMRGSEASKPKR